MPYRQSTEQLRSVIGAVGGAERLAERLSAAGRIARQLSMGDKAPGFLNVPSWRDDLPEIEAAAEMFRGRFDRVVIFGTGGSSLGARAMVALRDRSTGGPDIVFCDGIDSESLAVLLDLHAVRRSGFVAISKSGATAETVAATLLAIDAVRRDLSAAALPSRFMIVAEPGKSPLRKLAARFDLPTVDYPAGIGGRFSALTVSGLLPASIAGLDAKTLRDGAATVVDSLTLGEDSPPALGAALTVALAEACGANQDVLMIYGDRLAPLGCWWRQLWAESLGKQGQGLTPIVARGPADQHSQLQLYLDGPGDKAFTVLGASSPPGRAFADDLTDDPDLRYLKDRDAGDVMAAMRRAAVETLSAAGRPVREIEIDDVDAESIAALMMHFMLETVITAALMGVDPYDQPAVEDGKKRVRRLLSGEARS